MTYQNERTPYRAAPAYVYGSVGFIFQSRPKNLCSSVIMEGDLSKKSIHINELFVHAIYIGIVVNSYSDIVAYISIHTIDKFMYGFEKCLLLVCVCIIKRVNTYASY